VRALETERLRLRPLSTDDAAFIVELLNDPGWLQFIGDRGVRNTDDARDYIRSRPQAMYERHGVGLLLVESKADGAALGLCGLLRRDEVGEVDIGFAFLPSCRKLGYAREAATATLEFGRRELGLRRIVAYTSLDNERSIRLLEKLGFRYERTTRLPGETEDLKLFAIEFEEPGPDAV
jgi:RimJ/RimL family protein N-acetyltransferase